MNVDVSSDGRRVVLICSAICPRCPSKAAAARTPRRGLPAVWRSTCSRDSVPMESRSRSSAIAAGSSTCGWPTPMASTRVDLERAALVDQQPDVVAGRAIHLRAAAFRRRAIAWRRRSLDVSRERQQRGASDRARQHSKMRGEPALSPDGKTFYYSRDVSPGPNFDYNRDPYGVIYAIYARDLSTAVSGDGTARPGRSIAPRVSPNGKFLSFVRRVRAKSVLFVRNLDTGEETPVFDGLDRDLQEAWAIHYLSAVHGRGHPITAASSSGVAASCRARQCRRG